MGPIGDWKKNLGRHSRCGAERCNSRWRPRWPPPIYTQYNSIWICPGVINLVSLPTFWGQGIHWIHFQSVKSSG